MLTLSINMYSKELFSSLKKYMTYPITEKAKINVYFMVYERF